MKTCPDCNGDGVVDKDTDDERQCPTCGGLGFVPDDDDDHEEVIKTSRDLPAAKRRRQTMKGILCVSLLILLMPTSAYAYGGHQSVE
jgi:DnaJ-class molecular chaperone